MKRPGTITAALMVLVTSAFSLTVVGQVQATPGLHPTVAGGALGSVAGVVSIRTASEYCTGSVVGPKVVLTAAHCLISAGSPAGVRVRLDHAHRNLTVARYFVAPGFNATDHHDDAAVLILRSSSTAPALPVARTEPPAGSGATITGYGQQLFTSGATTSAYTADTIIQSLAYCQGAWAKFGAAMPSSDLCAQNAPFDNDTVTRGDSGGPLLTQLPDGRWAIAGINDLVVIPNHVYSGAIPQAFGRVNAIRPWIEHKIAQYD